MANKYFSESGLQKFTDKIKLNDAVSLTIAKEYTDEQVAANKIAVDSNLSSTSTNPVQNKVVNSAISSNLSSAKSYTDSEVAKVTSGTIVVKESEHAEKADSATTAANATNAQNANHANTADSATTAMSATSATSATKDSKGNVIADTYQTIANATSQHDALQSAIDGKANSSHSHSAATTSAAGFMSAADKEKLDGIAAGANNYTYTLPSAGSSLGGVKSGGDVTISSGVITVNDDSHNHIISNVDGLQSALDAKAASNHTHDDCYYTEDEIDETVASLESAISGKADSSHTHSISNVTNLQSSLDAKVPTSRTVNGKALSSNISLTASDVGADASGTAQTKANAALASAKSYTDQEIAELINSAPTTLDTLGEIATAMQENEDVVAALETAIGTKADSGHTHSNYASTVTTTGSGNAITAISQSGNTITATKGASFATSDHTHSAYVNQNAFSNVKVGDTTVAADSTTDTLTLIAGSNVTLTPDSTNDSVTIAAKDTVYTHPSYTSKSNGLYKISVDGTGHVSGTAAVAKSDITALGIPAQDTTYSDATTSTSGLMSSGDKTKLNGVATGAEVNQNAFSNVTIGSTTISADAKTDTLTLVAGSNVTLTPDATNDKITIAAKDTTYSSLKNPYSLTIQGNGTTLTNGTYDGSAAKTVNITPSAIGAAASSHTHDDRYYTESEIDSKLSGKSDTSHTHKYAGSSSAGGAANSVANSMTVKLNGGTTEGTNMFTFNGYAAKSVNITPSAIGAAASSHTHDDRYYTESEIDSKLSGKANTSHGNHVPATQTANNAVFLRNDNTWATVTPANIGAAASSHTHNYAGSSSAGGAANSAVKLATSRNITLSGDVAGTASFNGEANASITTTVSSMHGITTAGTGAAYTATVSGITSLTAGVSFIMIPHTNSTTTTPTLNVNGLGAKGLRMRGSTATGTAMTASIAAWLASGRPVQVTYNGVYWVSEVTRPAASDLSGTIGTAQIADGAVTASKLDPSLGLVSVSETEPTDGQVFLWIQV